MWIYKISNDINDKVYIGQTINSVENRFKRHINDSINNVFDCHFHRAIRKYGSEHFKVEIIDVARTQEELTLKEQYWINYYDSFKNGYNETDATYKCGGNTYRNKSKKQMEIISNKISKTKLGSKNPMARSIILKDINTDDKLIFNSIEDCVREMNLSCHALLSRRLRGETLSPLNGKYLVEYYNE